MQGRAGYNSHKINKCGQGKQVTIILLGLKRPQLYQLQLSEPYRASSSSGFRHWPTHLLADGHTAPQPICWWIPWFKRTLISTWAQVTACFSLPLTARFCFPQILIARDPSKGSSKVGETRMRVMFPPKCTKILILPEHNLKWKQKRKLTQCCHRKVINPKQIHIYQTEGEGDGRSQRTTVASRAFSWLGQLDQREDFPLIFTSQSPTPC